MKSNEPIANITIPIVKIVEKPRPVFSKAVVQEDQQALCPDSDKICILPGTSWKAPPAEARKVAVQAPIVAPSCVNPDQMRPVTRGVNSIDKKYVRDERWCKCGENCIGDNLHGTCKRKIEGTNGQGNSFLKYGVQITMACRVSCHSREKLRHTDAGALEIKNLIFDKEYKNFAFQQPRTWLDSLYRAGNEEISYYDSQSGRELFIAPRMRKQNDVVWESTVEGWPVFRYHEVNWDNVRIIAETSEIVSVDGTHLGLRSEDSKGARYVVNLSSIAGSPELLTRTTSSGVKSGTKGSAVDVTPNRASGSAFGDGWSPNQVRVASAGGN